MKTVTCTCWCEADTVAVPVEWVGEGRTAPCDLPDCEPGCPTRASDAFDDPEPEAPATTVTDINRKRIMVQDYDPRADSSPDIPESIRAAYPGLIIAQHPGVCQCGCGTRQTRKTRFLPGHDAKLKGKLQRAVAADVAVHEIGQDGEVHTTPAIDVARYYGWETIVQKGADRIVARSQTPLAAEKRLAKLVLDGREGFTLLEHSRWDQTGRSIALWREESTGVTEATYVTSEGTIETFRPGVAS